MEAKGKRPRRLAGLLVLVSAACALAGGCSSTGHLKRELIEPQAGRLRHDLRHAPSGNKKFLKAHMLDGRVYVLSDWAIEEPGRIMRGTGVRYDAGRVGTLSGEQSVPLDSVAIFETNSVQVSPSIATMTILTVGSLVMSAICVASPKTCFGSCPTFYVEGDPDSLLQAEGFSSSVAPSLEATDLDALHRARVSGPVVELRMMNEALETHIVRHADLLVAPRPAGGRVLATRAGRLRATGPLLAPCRCVAPEGECTETLAAGDGRERTSRCDSTDLASKEIVELTFHPVPQGELGLVIVARQSLLTTFLFYQLLAYMGSQLGDYLARLECGRGGEDREIRAFGPRLGAIEAEILSPGRGWVSIGATGEAGPLATDRHALPWRNPGLDTLHVRLRLTRGAWRLDHVALTALGDEVIAERLRPRAVRGPGGPDAEALACLLDSTKVLVTSPGDVYHLRYERPGGFDGCELFLESRGYYLEWMREEWLAEEDPAKAIALLLAPDAALRTLAPAYARIEASMDSLFWSSRYAR